GLTIEDRQYQIAPVDIYETGPTYHDLFLLGDALSVDEGTEPAGRALQAGDVQLAAVALGRSDGNGLVIQDPVLLATELEAAAESMSPVAPDLRLATTTLASALRAGEVPISPDIWSALADAVKSIGSTATTNRLYERLQTVDYVVISSNRIPAGITNMPWRYPVQIRLLELLQSGELGFDLVYEATDYPGIGPFAVPDDSADEAWLNYDHPHVWIYEKHELLAKRAFDLAFAEANAQPVSPTRYPPEEPLMLGQPVDSLPVVADGRWSAALTSNSAAALALWALLLLVLQVVGWPLASLLFGRFADGGWGFARLLTILGAGYLVWIGASLEVISFRAVWCAAALLILALAGWTLRLRWRSGRQLWLSRPGRPRTAYWVEGVFWGTFLVFLLFRLINPDSWHPVWGGEKPMEFAHLNAILRSAHFTPYDPWFAGGYINYYYYGMYLVAFLFKLTGIPSEIAFNLAQPTIMALLASGTFSLVATLGRDLVRRRSAAVPAGLVGVLMMVGMGNLTAFLKFFDTGKGGSGDRFDYYTWAGSRALGFDTITEFPYFTGLYADLHAHVVALPMTVLLVGLAYAISRDARGLATTLARYPSERAGLVLGLGRLAFAALAIGSLSATNAWDVPVYLAIIGVAIFTATRYLRSWTSRLAIALSFSAGVGAAAFALFIPFFMDYVALFGSLGRVRAPTTLGPFLSHFGALITIVGIGMVSLFFAAVPRRGPRWVHPLVLVGVLTGLLAAREALDGSDPAFDRVFVSLAVITTLLTIFASMLFGLRVVRDGRIGWQAALAGIAVVSTASVVAGHVVLGLMIALLAAGGLAWWIGTTSAARFTGLIVAAASATIAGTELVFLADDLAGGSAYRMNTVFKFYNQGWVLLGIAAATLTAWMGSAVLRRNWSQGAPPAAAPGIVPASFNHPPAMSEPLRWTVSNRSLPLGRVAWSWAQAGVFVTALAVAASLFYPALATGPRLEQRFAGHPAPATLNGLDWMEYGTLTVDTVDGPRVISFKDDRAAIDWFNSEIEGTPVIAEASIGPYRGNGSRFSIATGLPTILGWARHEYQQRYPEQIGRRERDVELLYATPNVQEKLSILDRYDVTYIVVGDLERLWTRDGDPYSSVEGIAAFEEMVGESLEIAFEHGDTTVYRVIAEDRR
ncbi:MAG TPA: DUF2298 domain-containing protein, partial [Thermomicrobiales bacterium]|nr:DUF2298 domain-containing protein [Thermomicrobiales bacterium]